MHAWPGYKHQMVKNGSNASTDLLHDQHLEQNVVHPMCFTVEIQAVNPAGVSGLWCA